MMVVAESRKNVTKLSGFLYNTYLIFNNCVRTAAQMLRHEKERFV